MNFLTITFVQALSFTFPCPWMTYLSFLGTFKYELTASFSGVQFSPVKTPASHPIQISPRPKHGRAIKGRVWALFLFILPWLSPSSSPTPCAAAGSFRVGRRCNSGTEKEGKGTKDSNPELGKDRLAPRV